MIHRINFERFVLEKELEYDTVPFDDDRLGFTFHQPIDNGPTLILSVIFDSDDTFADIKIFNVAKITDSLKKESYIDLVNDLNNIYRCTKFFVDKDMEVEASYTLFLPTTSYDYSSDIFDMLIMILQTVEESIPKFMRLQWS